MRAEVGGIVLGDEPAPDVDVVVDDDRARAAVIRAVEANPLAARMLV